MLLKVKETCRLRNVDGVPTEYELPAGKYLEARFRKYVKGTKSWKDGDHHSAWNVYVIGTGLRASHSRVGYVADGDVTVIGGQVDVRYGMVMGGGVVDVARCAHCDHASGLHVLPQSLASKAAMISLREKMNSNAKFRAGVKSSAMLGVLIAQGDGGTVTYASHSGAMNPSIAKAAEDLKFTYAPPICPKEVLDTANLPGGILNRRLQPADNGTPDFIQKYPYQCAAPNMIQKALYDGATMLSMTEAFFGSGEVQASCSRCQQTVPFMLCSAPRPRGLYD